MTRTLRSHRLPRALAIGALGAALAALVALVPAPAFAHDDLIGSTPEDGVVLEVAPSEVDLRFSAEPLAEPGGTMVRVIDPTGAEVQQGDPEIVDNGVIQALGADPAITGTYTVTWRVVSGDGHAISGELAFSVGEESEPAPPGDTPDAAGEAVDAGDAGEVTLWLVLGLVGFAAAGALVAVLVLRALRRRSGD